MISNQQAQSEGDGSAVAGLARELEQIRREIRDLQQVSGRVDELATVLAQLAETIVPSGSQQAPDSAPCWLDHPADPGLDPAESRAATDAAVLLGELASWVSSVYLRYSDAGIGLPDCWMRHPDVVEELLWLRSAWLAAYAAGSASTAVGDWHDRQRPGVVARIRAYVGGCSLDAHLPGHDQHAPSRGVEPADAVAVIADWWATARDQHAPTPTKAQIAAALARHRRARR